MTLKVVQSKTAGIAVFALVLSAISFDAALGQVSSPTQRQLPARVPIQPRPLSIEHLYWHFLVYQNHLDTKAAELQSKGKDSTLMRQYLQKQTGLPDADFARIRASSVRLTAAVRDLDSQAKAIKARGPSVSGLNQLKALTIQRETNINAEVATIRQSLSPAKVTTFEAFLTKFFSPSNAVQRPRKPDAQHASPAVQQ